MLGGHAIHRAPVNEEMAQRRPHDHATSGLWSGRGKGQRRVPMVTQSDIQDGHSSQGSQLMVGASTVAQGADAHVARTARVSVVVPAYNCATTIERLLLSLFQQTYPAHAFDIIVVDDASTDATATLAERLLTEWGGAGRVLRKPNGGPASARNAGWRASDADVIAFIDADCAAEPDWLAAVVGALDMAPSSDNATVVGGAACHIRNVAPPSWVSDYLTACDFYRQRERNGQVDYLITPNVAFRRAALDQVGGFAEHQGVWAEDADLSFRLKREGYALLLAPGGGVTHFGAPGTVANLCHKLYRYGFGSATLSRSWRNGRSPLTEFIRHSGAAALALPLALRLRRRVGWRRALAFTPLIAVEHLAFCSGIVAAVWSAAGRNSA